VCVCTPHASVCIQLVTVCCLVMFYSEELLMGLLIIYSCHKVQGVYKDNQICDIYSIAMLS